MKKVPGKFVSLIFATVLKSRFRKQKAVGSTIISASTSVQEALEGYQGHDLLTWAIARGLQGKADADKDGFIKTTELANYVDDEVPRIAQRQFKRAQYPTVSPSGQAFPVGKVK